METYTQGQILKFSEEGLDWLYAVEDGRRERAKKRRFEYRCITRNDSNCLTVRLLTGSYQTYHNSFLEAVESEVCHKTGYVE